jgi:hypothetical protein
LEVRASTCSDTEATSFAGRSKALSISVPPSPSDKLDDGLRTLS